MEVNRKKQEKCKDNKKGKQRGEGSVCLKEERNHDNNIIYTSREIGGYYNKTPKILSLGHFCCYLLIIGYLRGKYGNTDSKKLYRMQKDSLYTQRAA